MKVVEIFTVKNQLVSDTVSNKCLYSSAKEKAIIAFMTSPLARTTFLWYFSYYTENSSNKYPHYTIDCNQESNKIEMMYKSVCVCKSRRLSVVAVLTYVRISFVSIYRQTHRRQEETERHGRLFAFSQSINVNNISTRISMTSGAN